MTTVPANIPADDSPKKKKSVGRVTRKLLQTIAQREIVRASIEATAYAVAAIAAAIVLSVMIDWRADLHYAVRGGLLLAGIGVAAALAVPRIARAWNTRRDWDMQAFRLEQKIPESGSRIISAVQLAAGRGTAGSSTSLVTALVRQCDSLLAGHRPATLLPLGKAIKQLGIALGASAVLIGLIATTLTGRTLLARSLLVPNVAWPSQTKVEWLSPTGRVMAVGEEAVVRIKASGVIPSEGTLQIKLADGTSNSLPMSRESESSDIFTATLHGLTQSFSARGTLNDATTPWHEIKLLTRPVATTLTFEQLWPGYLKLPAHRPRRGRPHARPGQPAQAQPDHRSRSADSQPQ